MTGRPLFLRGQGASPPSVPLAPFGGAHTRASRSEGGASGRPKEAGGPAGRRREGREGDDTARWRRSGAQPSRTRQGSERASERGLSESGEGGQPAGRDSGTGNPGARLPPRPPRVTARGLSPHLAPRSRAPRRGRGAPTKPGPAANPDFPALIPSPPPAPADLPPPPSRAGSPAAGARPPAPRAPLPLAQHKGRRRRLAGPDAGPEGGRWPGRLKDGGSNPIGAPPTEPARSHFRAVRSKPERRRAWSPEKKQQNHQKIDGPRA